MSKTEERKIALAIIGKEATLSETETRAELDAMTAEDYDDWFIRALDDRNHGRVQMDPTGKYPEHPTTRLFRIGIESIRAGKPSEAFLTLLEDMADSAETTDVISAVYKTTPIKHATLQAASDYDAIASEFRLFVKEHHLRGTSYSTIKELFKKRSPHDSKKIDRALKQHHMDWEAKTGPTARAKPRKEGW